jgi:hypothetical protein
MPTPTEAMAPVFYLTKWRRFNVTKIEADIKITGGVMLVPVFGSSCNDSCDRGQNWAFLRLNFFHAFTWVGALCSFLSYCGNSLQLARASKAMFVAACVM